MSYRIQGLIEQFDVATGSVAAELGQLVGVSGTTDAEVSTANTDADLAHFPLTCDFDPTTDDQAPAQITGVASVFVEDATDIVFGSPVGVGATGVGVVLYASGYQVGIALAAPADDGVRIPVLLTNVSIPAAAE